MDISTNSYHGVMGTAETEKNVDTTASSQVAGQALVQKDSNIRQSIARDDLLMQDHDENLIIEEPRPQSSKGMRKTPINQQPSIQPRASSKGGERTNSGKRAIEVERQVRPSSGVPSSSTTKNKQVSSGSFLKNSGTEKSRANKGINQSFSMNDKKALEFGTGANNNLLGGKNHNLSFDQQLPQPVLSENKRLSTGTNVHGQQQKSPLNYEDLKKKLIKEYQKLFVSNQQAQNRDSLGSNASQQNKLYRSAKEQRQETGGRGNSSHTKQRPVGSSGKKQSAGSGV